MPQFDLLCYGILIWSIIFMLFLFHNYTIINIIPVFVEIKKLRLKKINGDILLKQTIIIINQFLKYNLILKKLCY